MYKVYCDGTKIYDLYTELYLIDPVLELELNSPGTFEFTMPADHPYFDLPQEMLSRVWIERDDEEIFRGRVIEVEIDFYNQKKIYCEGELAFLNDSIQRPAEYHNLSVRDYFKTLIDIHNSQVEEDKQFEIGYVLISDDNDSLYRYTNYNSTLEEMKDDLIDDYGGYIRVRNQNGHRYLDYVDIDNYAERNDQAIRFGVNLLDYTQTMDLTDIATVIIPLGERLEESPIEALDMRLTIESVNSGSDAIESEEAVKTYGRIVKTVIWDEVTVASNLLEKGKKYLSDYQWDPLVLEVTPVDLHDTDADTESFHLGDELRVISSPHGLDRYFPLSAMTIHLDSLDQNTFTLGTELKGKTLTGTVQTTIQQVKDVENEITPTQIILRQAQEQASSLITAATHGYVVIQPNDSPNEILIMDTDDTSTARRVWRWNLNGLGYSSTGYNGTYGTAITMDGSIVADFITTGTLTADIIRAGTIQDLQKNSYWNLNTGRLVINGDQFMLDSSGNFEINTNQFTLDSSGNASFSGTLQSPSGTIGGWNIGKNSFYNGASSMSSSKSGVYLGNDEPGIHIGNYDNGYNDYIKIRFYEIEIQEDDAYYTDLPTRTANLSGDQLRLYRGSYSSGYEMLMHNQYIWGYNQSHSRWLEISNYQTYIYANGSYLSGSDAILKKDIQPLSSERYDTFFDRLEPKTYCLKGSDEVHLGFVYQDVVEELEESGIDPEESALVQEVETNEETHETVGALAYNEIIALLVREVQELKTEVKELKAKLE